MSEGTLEKLKQFLFLKKEIPGLSPENTEMFLDLIAIYTSKMGNRLIDLVNAQTITLEELPDLKLDPTIELPEKNQRINTLAKEIFLKELVAIFQAEGGKEALLPVLSKQLRSESLQKLMKSVTAALEK